MLSGLDDVVDFLVLTGGVRDPHEHFIVGEMSAAPFHSVIGLCITLMIDCDKMLDYISYLYIHCRFGSFEYFKTVTLVRSEKIFFLY